MAKYLFLFLVFASFSAQADVIEDASFDGYKAGWFDAGRDSCERTCRAESVTAEHERFEAPDYRIKRTYVCKGKVSTSTFKGELYGNNLLNEKYKSYCFVLGPDSQVIHLTDFKCLCVY